MSKLLGVILSIVLIATLSLPASSEDLLDIRKLLTQTQQQSAGLHRLTSAEMDMLNAYLNAIVITAAQSMLSELETTIPGTGSYGAPSYDAQAFIESRISGEFEGWDGETVFKLINGQVWQQASYAYYYHYAYMPKVTIYKVGARYKMQVDGVSGSVYVKRIR